MYCENVIVKVKDTKKQNFQWFVSHAIQLFNFTPYLSNRQGMCAL